MGAAASVNAVYAEAVKWFQDYFDTEMYLSDFELMDKDNDGGISYGELAKWIKKKNEHEGGSWKVFLLNPEIIKFAHQLTAKSKAPGTVVTKKVVDVNEFRTLLVQLFAISILWVHFKNADDYQHSDDFGNLTLSLDEFRLAVRTLTESHAQETVSEEQIMEDFVTMDVDGSNSLQFVEVCAYCCQFIDPKHGTMNGSATAAQAAAAIVSNPPDQSVKSVREQMEEQLDPSIKNELSKKNNLVTDSDKLHRSKSLHTKNIEAVDGVLDAVNQNLAQAKLAEVKFATEDIVNDLFSDNPSDGGAAKKAAQASVDATINGTDGTVTSPNVEHDGSSSSLDVGEPVPASPLASS